MINQINNSPEIFSTAQHTIIYKTYFKTIAIQRIVQQQKWWLI